MGRAELAHSQHWELTTNIILYYSTVRFHYLLAINLSHHLMATSPCLRNLPGVSSCPAFVNHFSLSRHANATPAKSRVFMLKIKPGANVTLEQRLPIPNKTRIQLIIRNAVEDLVNTSRNHSKYTPLQNSPFEYLRYSQTFSSGFWQGFADFSFFALFTNSI